MSAAVYLLSICCLFAVYFCRVHNQRGDISWWDPGWSDSLP